MERHQQEISQLADAHLAGKRLPGMFPAIIPRVESDSELNAERSEGSQVKMSRSNSEGYLVQLEKQKHLKEKAGRQVRKHLSVQKQFCITDSWFLTIFVFIT